MARAVSTKKRLISRFFGFAWYDLTIGSTTFHPRELRREAYFFKSLKFRLGTDLDYAGFKVNVFDKKVS